MTCMSYIPHVIAARLMMDMSRGSTGGQRPAAEGAPIGASNEGEPWMAQPSAVAPIRAAAGPESDRDREGPTRAGRGHVTDLGSRPRPGDAASERSRSPGDEWRSRRLGASGAVGRAVRVAIAVARWASSQNRPAITIAWPVGVLAEWVRAAIAIAIA